MIFPERNGPHFTKGLVSQEEKHRIAVNRARELKTRINDYIQNSSIISTGFTAQSEISDNKQRIMDVLGATEEDWRNWKWQIRNRIEDVDTLSKIFELNPREKKEIEEVANYYRWSISPYYASLMNEERSSCPVWLQAVPCGLELLDSDGVSDPMSEELTSPAPCVTRRYPDRLIINVTNLCAMYCRHCQRRRNIGEVDKSETRNRLEAALEYIRSNPEIRDVLITGGDALMLSDNTLDWLLGEIDAIPHVEIKRIGTRTLVTLPQRITEELCAVLAKHPPLFINTQFNSPREVTAEAAAAADRLIRAGVVLGNQAVLLKRVNDDVHVMKKLNHELLKIRVRPYYLFQAKNVKGTKHFVTRVEKGIEIMEKLRGYTSGLAIPTFIINAPGGYGKTPMLPEYLVSMDTDNMTIRTWENRVIKYKNGH